MGEKNLTLKNTINNNMLIRKKYDLPTMHKFKSKKFDIKRLQEEALKLANDYGNDTTYRIPNGSVLSPEIYHFNSIFDDLKWFKVI